MKGPAKNECEWEGGYFKVPNALLKDGWLGLLSGPEKDALLILLFHQNMSGGLAYMGAKKIADIIGWKGTARNRERKVRRILARLERRGWKLREQIGGGRFRTQHRVIIPPPPVALGTMGPVVHRTMAPVAAQALSPVVPSATPELEELNKTNKRDPSTRGGAGGVGAGAGKRKKTKTPAKPKRTPEQRAVWEALRANGVESTAVRDELCANPKITPELIEWMSTGVEAGALVLKLREEDEIETATEEMRGVQEIQRQSRERAAKEQAAQARLAKAIKDLADEYKRDIFASEDTYRRVKAHADKNRKPEFVWDESAVARFWFVEEKLIPDDADKSFLRTAPVEAVRMAIVKYALKKQPHLAKEEAAA